MSNNNSGKVEEEIFCDSSCGVNASDALGYDVPCTCGVEDRIRTLKETKPDQLSKEIE